MPVEFNERITPEKLLELATLANSKDIPGKPYDFTQPQNPYDNQQPGWKTELARLRANVYSKFHLFNFQPVTVNFPLYEINYPSHPDMLVSGPWCFKDNISPDVTPDIFSQNTVSLGTFSAGYYEMAYVRGAMKYNKETGQWSVQNPTDGLGFRIVYNGGEVSAPGSTTQYGSQEQVEAANAGKRVPFYHRGGVIAVKFIDSPYSDNLAGNPTPTFTLMQGLQTCPLMAVEVGSNLNVRGQVPTWKDQRFVFVRSPAATVRTRLDLSTSYQSKLELADEEALNNYFWSNTDPNPANAYQAKYDFKVSGLNGSEFVANIIIPFSSKYDPAITGYTLTGANAGDCQIFVPYTDATAGIQYGFIRCTKTFDADFTFEVGIKQNIPGTTSSSSWIRMENWSFPFVGSFTKSVILDNLESNGEKIIPVIDNSEAFTITPPSMAGLCVVSKYSDADNYWERKGFLFAGNQAVITCRCLGKDNGSGNYTIVRNGVWVAKTYPLGGSYNFETINLDGILQGRNPHAYLPPVDYKGQPFSARSCNAVMYPAYEVCQYGEANALETGLLWYGAFIREICIRRCPVRQSDGKWFIPANKPELQVQIGTVLQNGLFERFQTFTIPAGQDQIIASFVCVANALQNETGQHFKLVYSCNEKVRVWCGVMAGLHFNVESNVSPARVSGSVLAERCSLDNRFTDAGISSMPGYPIRRDHFNDTEALLNLLS